jgi:hypothetical protein
MEQSCDKCGKTFDKPWLLKRHLERKIPCAFDTKMLRQRHECARCEKTFATSQGLSRHRATCNETENQNEIVELRAQMAELAKNMLVMSKAITPLIADHEKAPATPKVISAVQRHIKTTTTITTETEMTEIEITPWDGDAPCINITTAQIAKAFETNPILQEYASMHGDDMKDPQKTPDYIVELFVDLIRRGHEAPEARNIRMNPNRADQVRVRMKSGAWEVHALTDASRQLLGCVAAAMRRTTLRDEGRDVLSIDAQEALAWAGLHYGATPARYVRAAQKPLAAHLVNMDSLDGKLLANVGSAETRTSLCEE